MASAPRPIIAIGTISSGVLNATPIVRDLGVHTNGVTEPGGDGAGASASATEPALTEALAARADALRIGVSDAQQEALHDRVLRQLRAFGQARAQQAAGAGLAWWLLADIHAAANLDCLDEVFPEARYVVCRRDEAETVMSTLEANAGLSARDLALIIAQQADAIECFFTGARHPHVAVDFPDLVRQSDGLVYPLDSTRRLGAILYGGDEHEDSAAVASEPPPPRLPTDTIERPIFIIGCARGGTTLLFETLRESETLWSWWYEGIAFWNTHPALTPGSRLRTSDRLDEHDADPAFADQIREWMLLAGRDRQNRSYLAAGPRPGAGPYRFLEKTPASALRVAFLNALFPDALFVHLVRDGRANVSSLIEQLQHFDITPHWDQPAVRWRSFSQLPGWLLWPGWREDLDRPIEEIAARWYIASTQTALDDLAHVNDPARVYSLSYEEFIADPAKSVGEICAFAGLPFDAALRARSVGRLPHAASVSRPSADKWRRLYPDQIERVTPLLAPLLRRLGYEPH